MMNPAIDKLYPYPFEKLDALAAGCSPPPELSRIPLSIGEPKHAPPAFILDALIEHLSSGAATYPVSRGIDGLREACADWLTRRFGVAVDPASMILPVNGTREALFAFAQAVVDPAAGEAVLLPNPFYQIYEGAALLANAEPVYLNLLPENNFVADLDAVPESAWKRCSLFYVCSPGNPAGTVLDTGYYARLFELADQHDFVIASDECYADVYRGTPPPSILTACKELGRDRYERCVAFHSLSKRSNIPGLRSGFVAGDPGVMARFLKYRTYHGCAMALPTQHASIAAWRDDAHVAENRALYAQKYERVLPILNEAMAVSAPPASFYLWPHVGDDDEAFVRGLYQQQNVLALPGSYLGRTVDGINPGSGFVRLSLVASVEDCVDAAGRIRSFVTG
jgi:N-succinyldiaminopimelate aminotransferase